MDVSKNMTDLKEAVSKGGDVVLAALKVALFAANGAYERDSIQATIANLRLDAAIADAEIPIEEAGTAVPFSDPA